MTSSRGHAHGDTGGAQGAPALRPAIPPSPIEPESLPAPRPTVAQRIRRALIGAPRSLNDRRIFHRVSLVALLAWVGLGADGLSSSAYGPEEAFRALGDHTHLAVLLALLMAATVFIISAGYTRIIEQFPHGGGGYVVATKLLGRRLGLVSGCALIIDYILTITISIAAAGDAIFSLGFIPPEWQALKLPVEALIIGGLLVLNIRGVRESILVLAPVFFLFVITHTLAIGGGILGHAPDVPETAASVGEGFRAGATTLGIGGMVFLLIHAFSLGGGTYTGIEAVSNGIPMMRHPQVKTAKRTMLYMAVSLAFTATGLLVCYLLWDIAPAEGRTMNAALVERLAHGLPLGGLFIVLFLAAEAGILIVAAQAGFADGPRVLANMALDSWAPRKFAALSERLTTANGIVLMGGAALIALLYTRGDVRHIVVMYSINVFLTFSLSLLGMSVHTLRMRAHPAAAAQRPRKRRAALFITGFALCATILAFTAVDKFAVGGWVTLAATGTLVLGCTLIQRHYRAVARRMERAFEGLERIPDRADPSTPPTADPDPRRPTAVVLVGGYNGFGIHTTLNVFRAFPGHFQNIIFASIGTIDSGGFKGEDSIDLLRAATESMLARYAELAQRLGIPSTTRMAIGTDTVDEAEQLCLQIAAEFPKSTFFAGQVIFERETWLRRLLHNQTAYAIQRRLQWDGKNMVILAARA